MPKKRASYLSSPGTHTLSSRSPMVLSHSGGNPVRRGHTSQSPVDNLYCRNAIHRANSARLETDPSSDSHAKMRRTPAWLHPSPHHETVPGDVRTRVYRSAHYSG